MKFCCTALATFDENVNAYGTIDVYPYGIYFHDGNSTFLPFNFCPICGANLEIHDKEKNALINLNNICDDGFYA